MQISKFARVHVAIPTRHKFDKFLVRHGVSPTTQISYTYGYRMRQSKTKFTCASPKKRKRCFRPKLGKQSLPDSCYVLLKTCRTSGWFSFAQFGAYLLPTFYWKSIIHFQQKYWLLICIFLPTFHFSFMIKIGYFHIYSSYLSCSDAFATTIINIWPLKRKKWGVWWGSAPSEARASNF